MLLKRESAARQAKVKLRCPRCGLRESIASDKAEYMILCPRCGAGMREVIE